MFFQLFIDSWVSTRLLHGLATHLDISVTRFRYRTWIELAEAPRAIVEDHVRKHVAVNAKVIFACPTLISARFTGFLFLAVIGISFLPVGFTVLLDLRTLYVRYGWVGEWGETSLALFAAPLACSRPAYYSPIAEWKEVVVASRKMCGEEQCELAARACDG
jgi:hypothetical protein